MQQGARFPAFSRSCIRASRLHYTRRSSVCSIHSNLSPNQMCETRRTLSSSCCCGRRRHPGWQLSSGEPSSATCRDCSQNRPPHTFHPAKISSHLCAHNLLASCRVRAVGSFTSGTSIAHHAGQMDRVRSLRRRLVLILGAGVPQLNHIAIGSRTRVTRANPFPPSRGWNQCMSSAFHDGDWHAWHSQP